MRELYDANDYYIVPIPTTDFLQISPDDMIPYWTPDDNEIMFSDELKEWFSSLKKEYDDILSEEHKIDNMLQFVVDQIWYGVEKCYGAQIFAAFFEETLSHLNEKNYQALWILYGKMVHDPKYHENAEKPDKLACRRYMALMANKALRSKVFGF